MRKRSYLAKPLLTLINKRETWIQPYIKLIYTRLTHTHSDAKENENVSNTKIKNIKTMIFVKSLILLETAAISFYQGCR